MLPLDMGLLWVYIGYMRTAILTGHRIATMGAGMYAIFGMHKGQISYFGATDTQEQARDIARYYVVNQHTHITWTVECRNRSIPAMVADLQTNDWGPNKAWTDSFSL